MGLSIGIVDRQSFGWTVDGVPLIGAEPIGQEAPIIIREVETDRRIVLYRVAGLVDNSNAAESAGHACI